MDAAFFRATIAFCRIRRYYIFMACDINHDSFILQAVQSSGIISCALHFMGDICRCSEFFDYDNEQVINGFPLPAFARTSFTGMTGNSSPQAARLNEVAVPFDYTQGGPATAKRKRKSQHKVGGYIFLKTTPRINLGAKHF